MGGVESVVRVWEKSGITNVLPSTWVDKAVQSGPRPCLSDRVIPLKDRERGRGGGEGVQGTTFVPQELADGCNPLPKAHSKSIWSGWTWCVWLQRRESASLWEGSLNTRNPRLGKAAS